MTESEEKKLKALESSAWKQCGSHVVFDHSYLRLKAECVETPAGMEAEFVVIEGPDVAIVLPVTDTGGIYLVKQFRYPWGLASWEVPAGLQEEDEPIEKTAVRELEEECGLIAGRLEKILVFRPEGASNQVWHLFLATNLKKGVPKPDETEFIIYREFERVTIEHLVLENQIIHAPSLLSLLYYLQFIHILWDSQSSPSYSPLFRGVSQETTSTK